MSSGVKCNGSNYSYQYRPFSIIYITLSHYPPLVHLVTYAARIYLFFK